MFGLGPIEIGVIVLVLLLLFGPKQLPKFARAIGQTIGELKKTGNDLTSEVKEIPKTFQKILESEVK